MTYAIKNKLVSEKNNLIAIEQMKILSKSDSIKKIKYHENERLVKRRLERNLTTFLFTTKKSFFALKKNQIQKRSKIFITI